MKVTEQVTGVYYCVDCLNFRWEKKIHCDDSVFKARNRFVSVGTCMKTGAPVSTWCTCESWQDDA
jgi:hypothetical protein